MQRILGRKQADIVAMAHIHRPSVFPEPFERLDRLSAWMLGVGKRLTLGGE
jgi:hypothetical protein